MSPEGFKSKSSSEISQAVCVSNFYVLWKTGSLSIICIHKLSLLERSRLEESLIECLLSEDFPLHLIGEHGGKQSLASFLRPTTT